MSKLMMKRISTGNGQNWPDSTLVARWLCSVLLLVTSLVVLANGQFIHIYEVQDENRAPKSDLFDPSQYKYVSPSQLQKKQEQSKLLHSSLRQQQTTATSSNSNNQRSSSTLSNTTTINNTPINTSTIADNSSPTIQVPEFRNLSRIIQHQQQSNGPINSAVTYANDVRLNEIPQPQPILSLAEAKFISRPKNLNAYSVSDNLRSQNHHHHLQYTNNSRTTASQAAAATTTTTTTNTASQPQNQIQATTNRQQQLSQTTQPTSTSSLQSLNNHTTGGNRIPTSEQIDSELRRHVRMQQSENRYSRTQPLRVSAQNQHQYVVRVPPPFALNLLGNGNQSGLLLQQQLPPQLSAPYQLINQYGSVSQQQGIPLNQSAVNLRLSTLNSMLAHSPQQAQQQQQQQQQQFQQLQAAAQQQPQQARTQTLPTGGGGGGGRGVTVTVATPENVLLSNQPQPPYAVNLGNAYSNPVALSAASQNQPQGQAQQQSARQILQQQQQPSQQQQQQQSVANHSPNVLQGRSINGPIGNQITFLQPPSSVTNKESLTDEDIRLIEDHNRKVRYFLQQRQAELAAEQERARQQKFADEAAAKAQQEAAARAAAEQEKIKRVKAEQEAAARAAAEQERIQRLRAEQEAAARAAAEQERIQRIRAEQERIQRLRAEQEAAARAAAEQDRIRKLREQQEAAARAAAEQERIQRIRAEQERIQRLRAEQEAIVRVAAEQERIRKLREQQEVAIRLAAEQDRIRKIKAEQEALEQERVKKLREEQELAARAAAEHERVQKIRDEQERLQKLRNEQEYLAEQEKLRQLRAQQEQAIRLAEADRARLQQIQSIQELSALRNNLRYQNSQSQPLNISSNSLTYQPEPNLALDEPINSRSSGQNSQQQDTAAGLVDAARLRAEKEALAEQERLLRFQSTQQALAQQQAAEQARLRKLREEELIRAELERAAREAQENQIARARNEQNRLIQNAREAAARSQYTPYTDDINRYQPANTGSAAGNNYSVPQYTSLNNVRTPERTVSRASTQDLRISGDYPRRLTPNENSITAYINRTVGDVALTAVSTPQVISTPITNALSNNVSTFKPAKISLQELPPDGDLDGIPGIAGRDYPTLTDIPKTSFSCARQPLNGYYADTETACQVVHMCQMGGVQDSFVCPNGTIWNQEKFACQWWYEVNCATAPSFYALNNNLYKENNSERQNNNHGQQQQQGTTRTA